MFRMGLAADRIPAFVLNDQHVWATWPIRTALGGVRGQVPDVFVLHCPRCGMQDIRRRVAGEISFDILIAYSSASP